MHIKSALPGALLILVEAALIGLTANAVRSDGLPWIRVPLRETHRMASSEEVRPSAPPTAIPAPAPVVKPSVKTAGPTDEPKPTPTETAPVAQTQGAAPNTKPPTEAVEPVATVKPKIQTTKAKVAPKPTPAPAAVLPKPAKVEALFTSLTDAKALFDSGGAVFVDARHAEDFAVQHIPGAKNLFSDEWEALYSKVLGNTPKDKTIVTYCSDPQCDSAIKLADALVARGHTRVFILLDGIPGWRDAGYPVTEGNTP